MTTLTVLDNGNGTLTLSGTAVTDPGGGLVALAVGPGVVDNGDGTLTLTSSGAPPVIRDLLLTAWIEPGRYVGSIDPDELATTAAEPPPWTGYTEASRSSGRIDPDRYLGTLETG